MFHIKDTDTKYMKIFNINELKYIPHIKMNYRTE